MILFTSEIVDTLYRIIPENNALAVLHQEPGIISLTISVGDILTLVGMIASVCAFWWQLNDTRKANKENLRSTWFLDVIVEPNIEMINTFYKEIIEKSDAVVWNFLSKVSHLSNFKVSHLSNRK